MQIGGRALPAVYAGAQPEYPGLDQTNVQIPTSLKGAGVVTVAVTVDGVAANPLSIAIP